MRETLLAHKITTEKFMFLSKKRNDPIISTTLQCKRYYYGANKM